MNVSAAKADWVAVTYDLYTLTGDPGLAYLKFNRKPGIYLDAFDITSSISWSVNMGVDATTYNGIWSVPFNTAATLNNSSFLLSASGRQANVWYSVTRTVAKGGAVTLGHCTGATTTGFRSDVNTKYSYRVYPGDGSVAASGGASGSILGGAKTVTFSTPTTCTWPNPYVGAGRNNVVYGSLWPDVLVSYSTSGWPADPTYNSYNIRETYNSGTQKTTASLNLSANQTYYIKTRLAVDNGYSDRKDVEYGKVNSFVYYTYAAPTASPAAGTYTGAQQVTLSGAASGQTIRYTTDGSNPSATSPAYSGAVLVDKATTIKAQKYSGNTPVSPVSSFGYTINYAPASASPAAGMYYHTQNITLTPSVSGGELYYTLDGSVPSKSNGTKYEEPIHITDTTKLRVQQYQGDAARGGVADFDYIIQLPGVQADPAAGIILKGSDVTLSLAASDAQHTDIFYTLDVNQPREKWTAANFPIRVDEACTVYAVAQDKVSKRYGEVCEFAYTVTDTGYVLNDLSFWDGTTKVTSPDIAALAGKTINAKATITKIIPSIQGWLVTALYDPSGRAEAIKLDKLDQISGIATGTATGKGITLPADTTGYVLKTFIVHDFAQLRPIGAVVQVGEKME